LPGRKNQAQHFAARFAAKEAFFKALTLAKGERLNFQEIEVENNAQGIPAFKFKGGAAVLARLKKIHQVTLSLSHCQEYALAVVLIEKSK